MDLRTTPARKDGRVIIHFDYDCFYASVFEVKNPSLRDLPFAVQQKQIIVTCNYEARRRGLHKLQLITDARRICPEVIIELGEDISRFRDASKDLYNFLKDFSWNDKVERLGFDEVWMDITDIIDYNVDTLNRNDLEHSFMQMSPQDPTQGFVFDASTIAGHTYPAHYSKKATVDSGHDLLSLRLRMGSHFAMYLRHQLEQEKGYTCTVGIATSKLLSKLVGNLNKPKGQTTLMPPLLVSETEKSNAIAFMDTHEIGKVPGIGFKLAQKLREAILERAPAFDTGLVYGGTREKVSVADVRQHASTTPEMLEKLLSGPGSAHGIGYKVWCLLHGVDDSEVGQARSVPRQISIEDSYIRLDTMSEVLRELTDLSRSLITRMRIDLLGGADDEEEENIPNDGSKCEAITKPTALPAGKKWMAHPKTLRLSTRPRQPLQPDGTRVRSFKRISHSAPLPMFVFSLHESVDALAEKLVKEVIVSMFRRLHPEKSGWNLSLVNLAVTNMAEAAGNSKTANGRDIGTMFRKQEDVLKDFRVTSPSLSPELKAISKQHSVDDKNTPRTHKDGTGDEPLAWDDEDAGEEADEACSACGMRIPMFAMVAHQRYHSIGTTD